jgi:hypothetical protein
MTDLPRDKPAGQSTSTDAGGQHDDHRDDHRGRHQNSSRSQASAVTELRSWVPIILTCVTLVGSFFVARERLDQLSTDQVELRATFARTAASNADEINKLKDTQNTQQTLVAKEVAELKSSNGLLMAELRMGRSEQEKGMSNLSRQIESLSTDRYREIDASRDFALRDLQLKTLERRLEVLDMQYRDLKATSKPNSN